MQLKYLDFGTPYKPQRGYTYDAGMDVYMPVDFDIKPGETVRIPLGFGVEVPAGFVGFIIMRSSLSTKGLVSGHNAIDATYNGEVSAIITNASKNTYHFDAGDRVCSLIVHPVMIFDWTTDPKLRNANATGSTGTKGKPKLNKN